MNVTEIEVTTNEEAKATDVELIELTLEQLGDVGGGTTYVLY
jgi:hypothetical protein